MVLTHPIYYGADNIEEYFSNNQVSVIDIKYPKTVIANIEKLIEDNFYEKNLSQLIQARKLVMSKYNSFNLIYEISTSDEQNSFKYSMPTKVVKIKEEDYFLKYSSISIKSSKKIFFTKLKKRIAKSLLKKITKLNNYLQDIFLLIKFRIKNARSKN
jgi:hypothetical protein